MRYTERHGGVAVIKDKSKHKEAMEKLAEYEDLQEQGLLLKLPCKVGAQVFIINHYWIDEGFICGIAEADDIDCFCFKVYEDPVTCTLIAIDDFEKGWFLTEQEAQAALEKMKNETLL